VLQSGFAINNTLLSVIYSSLS